MTLIDGDFKTCNDDARKKSKLSTKGLIIGEAGRGKTSLLWTLPENNTLFVDAENGSQVISGWSGTSQRVKTWPDCQILALMLTNKSDLPEAGKSEIYTLENMLEIQKRFADRDIDQYRNVFIDSMTKCSDLCFMWCAANTALPRTISARDMNIGIWTAFSDEFGHWINCIYSSSERNVWSTSLLTSRDEDGITSHQPHLRSKKMASHLMAANDEVFTMIKHADKTGKPSRAFVCHDINPWDYPAKDRSGALNDLEACHLGRIIEKINSAPQNRKSMMKYANL